MKSSALRASVIAIASFALLTLGATPGIGPVTASAAVGPSGGCVPGTTSTTCTFIKTGAPEQWTVPVGVTSITVGAWGGHGYRGYPVSREQFDGETPGGAGAEITATLSVTPGDALDVNVAGDAWSAGPWAPIPGGHNSSCGGHYGCGGYGGGGTAHYAGGGGGASSVKIQGGSLLLAAGGGGGEGFEGPCQVDPFFSAGVGGNAGSSGGTGDSCTSMGGITIQGSTGGGAGSDSAGGAGGVGSVVGAVTGSDPTCFPLPLMFIQGDTGASGGLSTGANGYQGGSGGGGYYGGGAGGGPSVLIASDGPTCFPHVDGGSGGGGGGSNYIDPAATDVTTGVSDRAMGSDGLVEITYAAATTLTINAPRKVEAGSRVKITGTLSSGDASCTDLETVNLMKGSKSLNWNLTSAVGAYKFNLKVTRKTTVHVTFEGTAGCAPVTSDSRTIKVT